MSTPHDNQPELRLTPAPRPETVELLYRTFGDVLIPLEHLRIRYFHNLNEDSFSRSIKERRIPLPITTLDPSPKRLCDVRHLAAWIDSRAWQADEAYARLGSNE
ncbi:transcriptional regulator [Pseudomonas aeruginosa]|uniref:pyocin activator PrtN family protein n=1 Tax=Pseudomonas aeruginosa TaxID=287 RepID=UPI000B418B04|nr:pyocin activator PrtN family protein [Pseudomonas aeruginosa]OVZ28241.1 transcriptional regulator [Pseudomonas aeruginosa]